MFPDTLMQVIVNQTNRYAQQVMDDNSYAKWKRVDLAEMKAYFGFNILMGLVPMPAIDDYWKLDPHFNFGPISSHISRNRFREISRFLHFVDNATLPTRGEEGYDKLGKVRPIIDAVSAAIRVSYAPSKEIAVDEAMIAFQGLSAIKQYMPLKPVKRGIKVWCLADSNNGYIHAFDVYTGKTETKEDGLGTRVVLMLSSHLQDCNHHLYCDNFFSSTTLFTKLLDKGIYACGTIRSSSKGFPDDLKIPAKKKKVAETKLGLKNR